MKYLLLLGLSVFFASHAEVPQSRSQISLSYAPLVRQVAPAVVNIYTSQKVETSPLLPFFDDPFLRQFFEGQDIPSQERQSVQTSLGSGVLVRADGLVVTNYHVVKEGTEIKVVLADRREFLADVVVKDERTDLAVLKLKAPPSMVFPVLELHDMKNIEVGDLVLAIGNPFGVGQTVTSGIISAVSRTQVGINDYQSFVQTDAAINPGNSGGALVTMDGRLVGINTAIYSRSGGSIGIGFAIPSSMVRQVVAAVSQGGKVIRPWVGMAVDTISADIAESLGLDLPRGVLVRSLNKDGPAQKAGFKVGDIILEMDGQSIQDDDDFRFKIAVQSVGTNVSLLVRRGQKEMKLSLALQAPPESPFKPVVVGGAVPLSGAVVAATSPSLAAKIGLDTLPDGVIVVEIERGSPAHRLGLRPGDVIKQINGVKLATLEELQSVLKKSATEWYMRFSRKGKDHEVRIRF